MRVSGSPPFVLVRTNQPQGASPRLGEIEPGLAPCG